MDMLSLDAYSGRDLQNFMQMLNQCESAGVTDIRFVRESLHKHLYSPQKIRPVRPGKTKTPEYLCPGCGRPMDYVPNNAGLKILGCGSCRFSEVV